MAEYYLETDNIKLSQYWLEKTKDLVSPKVTDSTTVFIHSLQSELYYYDGLFQFGTNEAEKAIEKATKLRDSLLIADGYFFKGINQFEMSEYNEAEKLLWKARNFQPKTIRNNRIRSAIQNEYIFNNIAQLKLKKQQPDSAIWYNLRAYQFAKQNQSKRGIPNTEQTFGQIYLQKQNRDSAAIYLQRSLFSAQKSNYFDVVLLDYGYLMSCFDKNQEVADQYFEKGQKLIDTKIINLAFKRLFYNIALDVFQKNNQIDKVAFVQHKIIAIDDKTKLKGNSYIQNITEQYAKNETKLLKLQIDELKKEREFSILQLIAALLSVVLLSLVIIIIRRKNKLQKNLLRQKNEISKDLHDDIGSGLSSILIHADLLLKSGDADEKQKLLASKIGQTGKEISQRLNTFIWSLNAEHNTLQDFLEYLKHYGTTLFDETAVKFTFDNEIYDTEIIKMNGQMRKNLFYAVKEVLNNSLKHANGTSLDLTVRLLPSNQLQIRIQDNGSGIVKENSFGNGLKNIQNRVEELKGTSTVKTDSGLLTVISIPL
ncbi:ATP-binding protein [Flavobacterium sp.]|uniref:sensor histidine kinase n=1 Tax=Flavobacterium sp. TaxID=239 RepID=UPI00248A6C51|nr:ATP-binding protein [Flavobacterium sp.]MDI1317695.1 histidine kinase [Flavobacterium sp.]